MANADASNGAAGYAFRPGDWCSSALSPAVATLPLALLCLHIQSSSGLAQNVSYEELERQWLAYRSAHTFKCVDMNDDSNVSEMTHLFACNPYMTILPQYRYGSWESETERLEREARGQWVRDGGCVATSTGGTRCKNPTNRPAEVHSFGNWAR